VGSNAGVDVLDLQAGQFGVTQSGVDGDEQQGVVAVRPVRKMFGAVAPW
jgi:hypothetical protein